MLYRVEMKVKIWALAPAQLHMWLVQLQWLVPLQQSPSRTPQASSQWRSPPSHDQCGHN